ncbi:hypothetical protein LCGC14_1267710 [marine sediment metagenome]|uniref:Uncharacterized protein n=1 Tax=marine sediment metagenome TaxID=412755 RepID=A0A0F9NFN4_9ZZZZ|nr:hypothetical protein [bacterium]
MDNVNAADFEEKLKELIPAKLQIKKINEELLRIIRDYDLLEKKLRAENAFLVNKILGLENKLSNLFNANMSNNDSLIKKFQDISKINTYRGIELRDQKKKIENLELKVSQFDKLEEKFNSYMDDLSESLHTLRDGKYK